MKKSAFTILINHMNLNRLISTFFVMIAFVMISSAQDNKLSYGYVEKTNDGSLTTHYSHIIIEGNQLIMNRIAFYTDSTNRELGRQERKETYNLTDNEIDQLTQQMLNVLESSKMPRIANVKNENILLSQDIEAKIGLNSKKNIVQIGDKTYYLEYELKMSGSEYDKFMEYEGILETVSRPIHQILNQKRSNY